MCLIMMIFHCTFRVEGKRAHGTWEGGNAFPMYGIDRRPVHRQLVKCLTKPGLGPNGWKKGLDMVFQGKRGKPVIWPWESLFPFR